jgi:RNA polymerase sigma-70 factor, ECF subfamily
MREINSRWSAGERKDFVGRFRHSQTQQRREAFVVSTQLTDTLRESNEVVASEGNGQNQTMRSDPSVWVDLHGDYLYRYALLRLRDAALAEDAVQETLLAALQSRRDFEGRSAERTWLTGILKHKLVDHFRKVGRIVFVGQVEGEEFEHEELFKQEGKWRDHFDPARAPVEWCASPSELLEQGEFWEVFQKCISPLPARIGSAFTLREMEGLSSEEICEVLGITVNNLWVMLHRARMHLRRCLELNWFTASGARK